MKDMPSESIYLSVQPTEYVTAKGRVLSRPLAAYHSLSRITTKYGSSTPLFKLFQKINQLYLTS